jgi:hypothetical protein
MQPRLRIKRLGEGMRDKPKAPEHNRANQEARLRRN